MTEELILKKKEILYRGKTIEDLKVMETREFASLLKSNEKRTLLRQTDEIEKFIIRAKRKLIKGKPIRTHQRDLVIVPRLVGMKVNVYSGKEFLPLEITIEMLGHRLGEFAVTRQKVKHGSAGVGATRSSASKSVK